MGQISSKTEPKYIRLKMLSATGRTRLPGRSFCPPPLLVHGICLRVNNNWEYADNGADKLLIMGYSFLQEGGTENYSVYQNAYNSMHFKRVVSMKLCILGLYSQLKDPM